MSTTCFKEWLCLWVPLDVISLLYLNSGTDVTVLETGSSENRESVMTGEEPSADSCITSQEQSFVLCWACFIRACKQLTEDNVIFICLQPNVLNHTCVHFWSINSLKFSDIISSQISWFLYTTRLKKTAVSLYSSDTEEWAMLNRRMLFDSVKYYI